MAQEVMLVTETKVLPFIQPKTAELISLIGKNALTAETSFAIQAANSNSYLAQATPQSIAKCVWNVAITGLSLNPVLKLAYLTPRKVNGIVEAVLMPSYQGMAKLITDTGSVKKIVAQVVYKGDIFDVEYGMDTKIIHKPKFITRKNEDVTHVYAIALLVDGSQQFEVMSLDEVHSIRSRSDGYRAFKDGKTNSCIWESDFGEMCRKTVIKRLCKYLPKSVRNKEWERVMNAVDIDNKDYPMSASQEGYARTLLDNSTYDHEQRGHIENQLSNGLSSGDCEKIIDDLLLNQMDRITQSGSANQTDIKEKIHEISSK